eukprot:m.125629 g.125629  ORF g.125629 m.125629 type:complete len:490 (-) comp12984_c4_seq1:56-1525(-)
MCSDRVRGSETASSSSTRKQTQPPAPMKQQTSGLKALLATVVHIISTSRNPTSTFKLKPAQWMGIVYRHSAKIDALIKEKYPSKPMPHPYVTLRVDICTKQLESSLVLERWWFTLTPAEQTITTLQMKMFLRALHLHLRLQPLYSALLRPSAPHVEVDVSFNDPIEPMKGDYSPLKTITEIFGAGRKVIFKLAMQTHKDPHFVLAQQQQQLQQQQQQPQSRDRSATIDVVRSKLSTQPRSSNTTVPLSSSTAATMMARTTTTTSPPAPIPLKTDRVRIASAPGDVLLARQKVRAQYMKEKELQTRLSSQQQQQRQEQSSQHMSQHMSQTQHPQQQQQQHPRQPHPQQVPQHHLQQQPQFRQQPINVHDHHQQQLQHQLYQQHNPHFLLSSHQQQQYVLPQQKQQQQLYNFQVPTQQQPFPPHQQQQQQQQEEIAQNPMKRSKQMPTPATTATTTTTTIAPSVSSTATTSTTIPTSTQAAPPSFETITID